MAKLIVRYPNNEIKEIDFDKPIYKIGKAPDNDLVIDIDDIDDHQAIIESSNGVFTLVDTSEKKSTKVNGKQIERVNITYGDRISFGSMVILFYPSKKKGGLSDRFKIAQYISAGAVIIVASIIIIFILITPKISSSVAKNIGGTYLESGGKVTSEETFKKREGKIKEGIQRERVIVTEPIKKSRKEKESKRVEIEKEKPTFFQKIFSIFTRKVEVALPEPTDTEISRRKAVAVPRGIRRLFFRKKLIYIEVREEKQKKGTVKNEVVKLEKVETGLKKEVSTNIKKTEVEKSSTSEENQTQNQQVETAQKKGILNVISSPFKKLYGLIFKRKTEITVEESQVVQESTVQTQREKTTVEIASPKVKETEKVIGEGGTIAKLPEEAVEAIVNPLIEINKIELRQVKSRLPKETPIYSADELKRISEENLFEDIVLSEKENIEAEVVWKFPSSIGVKQPGKVIYGGSAGTINDNRIPDFIFSTEDGKLITLNGMNGEEILNLNLKASLYSPIISGKRKKNRNILVTYKNGKIESFTRTLERKWFAVEDHPITALPVLVDINRDKVDDVIVSTLGMEIVAIDGKTGFELWRFSDLTGDVDTSAIGVDVNKDKVPDIVVNSIDGYINVIDGKTGWGLWKRKIYGRPAGSPLFVDLNEDGEDELVSLTKNGILTSYSLNGKNLFTISLGKKFIIPPSAGDVNNNDILDLVFMSTDGEVQAIEGKSRKVLWKYETEEKTTFGRLAIADVNMDKSQDVIFSVPSGLVYVLDGSTGSPLTIFNTKDFILSTPIIYDFNRDKVSEVVVPTYNGTIFCIKVSGVKKPFFYMRKSSWPCINHDTKNSGVSMINYGLIFWKRW